MVDFNFDGEKIKKPFKNLKRHYILELGTLEGGKSGRIVNNDDSEDSIDARVYRVNFDSLKKLYYILNKNPLVLSKISDTKLVGKVHTVEGTTLFTSIPYDEGWSVYVDGQKTEKIKLMDAFIGLELEKGQHEIKFVYRSMGIIQGAIISVISLAILLLIFLIRKFILNGSLKIENILEKFGKKERLYDSDEFEEIDIDDVEFDELDMEEIDLDNVPATYYDKLKNEVELKSGKEELDINKQNEDIDSDFKDFYDEF